MEAYVDIRAQAAASSSLAPLSSWSKLKTTEHNVEATW